MPVAEMSFDFDCNFIKRYFGDDKKRLISYFDFCQLLHDFHEEQGTQAFKLYAFTIFIKSLKKIEIKIKY
jgi:hypothetical protein